MDAFKEVQKIWGAIPATENITDINFNLQLQQKLLSIFHVGSFYSYVVNVRQAKLEYMSPEMNAILGYDQDTVSELNDFVSLVHPEDIPFFLNFESAAESFFNGLSGDTLFKYKVQYDLRFKKKDGDYVRILHQYVIIQHDQFDVKTFAVDTDITHLKQNGVPQLSIIGLDGKPSYFNIDTKKLFIPVKPFFTGRQREILKALSEGLSSQQISEKLHISKYTVDSHRKNMLKKSGAKSTYEIIQLAFKNGWV